MHSKTWESNKKSPGTGEPIRQIKKDNSNRHTYMHT